MKDQKPVKAQAPKEEKPQAPRPEKAQEIPWVINKIVYQGRTYNLWECITPHGSIYRLDKKISPEQFETKPIALRALAKYARRYSAIKKGR